MGGGSFISVFKFYLLPVFSQMGQNRDVNLIDCILCAL